MRLIYIPAAQKEWEKKLKEVAKNPFTTHSLSDLIKDIDFLEKALILNPELRRTPHAPAGWYQVGPSPIYRYTLIYRLIDGNATSWPRQLQGGTPLYWIRRRVKPFRTEH